jgi:hypothetical protein
MIMKTVEVGVVIYVPEFRGIKSSTIPIFREKPTVHYLHPFCHLPLSYFISKLPSPSARPSSLMSETQDLEWEEWDASTSPLSFVHHCLAGSFAGVVSSPGLLVGVLEYE